MNSEQMQVSLGAKSGYIQGLLCRGVGRGVGRVGHGPPFFVCSARRKKCPTVLERRSGLRSSAVPSVPWICP